MSTTADAREQIEKTAAALTIELAFLLPRGTNVREHPAIKALMAYMGAIETRVEALTIERDDAVRALELYTSDSLNEQP